MIKEPRVQLFDLIECLSKAMDLVCPSLVNHHERVAYIAFSIGAEIGLPPERLRELVLAGSLHDSGALSLRERLDALRFDVEDPFEHAELGYLLLRSFEPLGAVARLVRHHHVHWDSRGEVSDAAGEDIPLGSHILHLADRVAVLIRDGEDTLGQVRGICEKIVERSGSLFSPELVEVFRSLAVKEYFWLDAASDSPGGVLRSMVGLETTELSLRGLLGLSNLFRQIIDFRSRFTATHSVGVAVSAEALAREAGFSDRECLMMRVAGHLHDLGKLAVPVEVLEKPGRLTESEVGIIRSHTFHTYRILEPIRDLETINAWGAFHHERIDGTGYPFHHRGEDLSLGSRIMAVADVFTAVTEDRPYRAGMAKDKALWLLQGMASEGGLDPAVVGMLERRYDEINATRIAAQRAADEEYRRFRPPPPRRHAG
ncbi:MAG: HD domain-containing protein [Deltaproteobacteria bacterium]|nr:HD domain-containing protein [Deltaproteobacteria bacterium]